MKTPFKSVVLLSLPLLLSGCFHKVEQVQNQPLAPPIEDAPPPAPQPSPTELPPPVVTVPSSQSAANTTTPPKSDEKPAKRVAHHPKPDSKTEQASNTVPAVSAIGQLSSGDPADLRQQTEDSIASTEHGLKDINRSLNDQEQKTVAQIREFLKQAHTALTAGDVDGAHTLALKAKVLLGEIAP